MPCITASSLPLWCPKHFIFFKRRTWVFFAFFDFLFVCSKQAGFGGRLKWRPAIYCARRSKDIIQLPCAKDIFSPPKLDLIKCERYVLSKSVGFSDRSSYGCPVQKIFSLEIRYHKVQKIFLTKSGGFSYRLSYGRLFANCQLAS